MARPREFDEKQVLDRALEAFWARGFDATSIEDLVIATGLGRASLYGAFGDKEQLFRTVLKHYVERSALELEEAAGKLKGRAALEALFALRIERDGRKGRSAGCFLQISATTGTSGPLAREAMDAGMRGVVAWLKSRLEEAKSQGELAPSADLDALSNYLLVFVQGLTAAVKAGTSSPVLESAASAALDLIFERDERRSS